MNVSQRNVVAVGDAENDHILFDVSECSAAVANALPSVKEHADIILNGDHGSGVAELIDMLLSNDLENCQKKRNRHFISLGTSTTGEPVICSAFDYRILVAGPSQSGKSTTTMSILEQFVQSGCQYIVIDPEGDYQGAPKAVSIGNAHYVPRIDDVIRLLENPSQNVVVNLLGVPLSERTAFLTNILVPLQSMRRERGRPHWIVIDEAHHMLHPYWDQTITPIWHDPGAMLIVTIDASQIANSVLSSVDLAIAVGSDPRGSLEDMAKALGQTLPTFEVEEDLGWGEAVAWFRTDGQAPEKLSMQASPIERHRHRRKYAEGNVGAQRSFYFTGPQNKLKIRCQNLFLFLQIGDGVDDETWLFHLKRGDYSSWIRDVIKDTVLAVEIREVERQINSAVESRAKLRALIEKRYTFAASPTGK